MDQTNHSVVVGESVVVKWFTPPAPLPQPAPDVLAHLAETGFTATATPYAALCREGRLLALVTAYLPGAVDGWQWCVEEAAAGRTAFAADLGALAADLHAALATPSATFPDPVRRAHDLGRDLAARAEKALREALALTGDTGDTAGDTDEDTDGRWLRERADALRAGLAPLASTGPTPLVRVHGDLHVGQILRWREGYAVIDFDGNPTVTEADLHQPVARDLAQLTTSLEHAGQVAVRRRGADPSATGRWAAEAVAVLGEAYLTRLAEHGHAGLLDRSLLHPFEIEQECRELIYAARHLPRWRYAPMGVLRSRYP
ncbi:hypothetical protein [Streptosporangium jomthongense]|uniref:Glucosamine kinase n=1 Tax=Streptosporangium jomthongense TaxID=1193683 RepID=A0ABV8F800_9ACTN